MMSSQDDTLDLPEMEKQLQTNMVEIVFFGL